MNSRQISNQYQFDSYLYHIFILKIRTNGTSQMRLVFGQQTL